MPVFSRDTASHTQAIEGFLTRYENVDGYTIAFETHTRDADLAHLSKGLPGDRCQAAHWGVVLKGKLIYRYGEGRTSSPPARPTTPGRATPPCCSRVPN